MPKPLKAEPKTGFIAWAEQPTAAFIAQLNAQWPSAQCELNFKEDFDCLVAIVLSAQATDKQVNRVMQRLFETPLDPDGMVALGIEKIREILKPLGLGQQKAHYIFEIAKRLQEKPQLPDSLEELMQFPGVGRKTAQVFLCMRRGTPAFPVDTHIFRVCNRTAFAPGATPRAVERALRERLDPIQTREFHLRMVLHGRYICKARTPLCAQCNLISSCPFAKTLVKPVDSSCQA